MKIRLLGTAAGGGVPQWNCACPSCEHARQARTHRTQECALISGNGTDWYLINASPDLRTQLIAAPEVTPGPGRRQTPLRGVFLTDAELDHTLGLFSLREAESLDVYATPAVLAALENAMPVKAMTNARWHAITIGEEIVLPGLTVTAFPLGEKRPRYAADVEGTGWVIGYRLARSPQLPGSSSNIPEAVMIKEGDAVVYAPCFPEWTAELDAALEGAQIAVIDGTFHADSEMPNVTGHLSIQDSRKHLKRFEHTEFRYTHLNNTNPLLQDPQGLPLAGEMELL